jgi:hypothetical protein
MTRFKSKIERERDKVEYKPRKRSAILASYKNISLPDLRAVIERNGDKYTAEYPIFDKTRDVLLLNRGQSISEDRLRQMELSNLRYQKTHKESKYYFQRKTAQNN